jgi:hypothetical protein
MQTYNFRTEHNKLFQITNTFYTVLCTTADKKRTRMSSRAKRRGGGNNNKGAPPRGAKKLSRRQEKQQQRQQRRQQRLVEERRSAATGAVAQLEAIASREKGICGRLSRPLLWARHACGNSMLARESDGWAGGPAAAPRGIFSQAAHASVAARLGARGCTVVESCAAEAAAAAASSADSLMVLDPLRPTFRWGVEYERMLSRVDATMESLKAAGWPPVFVFLFDEPWLLIDRLFELVAPVLGEDCFLESSIYGWALSRSKACHAAGADADAPAAEVGGNFAVPHRDNAYADCNFPDGTPSHLSLWMCVNDVGLDNGCMHVLPKDCDPRFHLTKDYWHERVAFSGAGQVRNSVRPPAEQLVLNFPMDKALPMPAPRGSVLLWQPNCIHWGSSCSPSSFLEPRKSIAMSFRVSADRRPIASYERDLLSREKVRALSLEDRLVIVAESMLMYSKWFPAFKAFDLSLLAVADDDATGQDQTHQPQHAPGKSSSGRIEVAVVVPPPPAAGTVPAAPAEPSGLLPCPCCREATLCERGEFELCRRCGWEDDGQGDADADVHRDGPNPTSLTEARRLWAEQIEAGHRENEQGDGP